MVVPGIRAVAIPAMLATRLHIANSPVHHTHDPHVPFPHFTLRTTHQLFKFIGRLHTCLRVGLVYELGWPPGSVDKSGQPVGRE